MFYYLFTGPLGLRRRVPHTHTHTHKKYYTHRVYIRDYTLLILPVAVMHPLLRVGDGMVFFLHHSVPEKFFSCSFTVLCTRRRSTVVHIIIYLSSRRHSSRCRRMASVREISPRPLTRCNVPSLYFNVARPYMCIYIHIYT